MDEPTGAWKNTTRGILTLAFRCVPLPVSAAFHSRDMPSAARRFADVLAEAQLAPPKLPVIANVTAAP
ncbi:hypothetical protein ACFVS9_06615 [Streptomyces sp. NPDC058008]|uniref:hypothetical protein n=1 Tax=Streptomyces sp. NPDC058008 TaxID=3346303 RepID=UPI0036E4AE9D